MDINRHRIASISVIRLNDLLKKTAENLGRLEGGVYYVDGFQNKFDGHRFCEVEQDKKYHKKPIDARTWFIHYQSPYENHSSVTGLGAGNFFDQVNSILIPKKDGISTEDQINAVNGDLAKLNPAYKDEESMTAALLKLGKDDVEYQLLPTTWIRMMHPKGSEYATMSDAVIDNVLRFGAQGGDGKDPTKGPPGPDGHKCASSDGNKFLGRDDMNDKIGKFCADAAKQCARQG